MYLFETSNYSSPKATLVGHYRDVSVCHAMNEMALVTGSLDGTIKLWNSENFECQRTLSLGSGITGIQVLNDSKLVVSLESGKLALVRVDGSPEESGVLHILFGHSGPVQHIEWDRNARIVTCCSNETSWKLWKFSQNQKPFSLKIGLK